MMDPPEFQLPQLMIRKPLCCPSILFAGITSITLATGQADVINQIANSTAILWNEAGNWTGGAAASAVNSYVTVPGLAAAADNGLGVNITSRLRDNATVFAGSSLTIVAGTEVLLKNGTNSTSSGNLILSGGAIRYGPNGNNPAITTTLAGNLNIAADSVIGLGGNNTFIVSSTLTGSGILGIRGATGATTSTLSFSGNLSGFQGSFDVGGGSGPITMDFNQDYNLAVGVVMGGHTSVDILKLDQAITLKSFKFGATLLAPGTYTAAQLNPLFGNGSQFIGAGTLTIPNGLGEAYATWATGFGLTEANKGVDLDPDHDGQSNLDEFAFDGNPLSNTSFSKSFAKISTVNGAPAITLTVPIRNGATTFGSNLTAFADGITYDIQASTDLVNWNLTVAEVPVGDRGPLQALATAPGAGYTNRFFYVPSSEPATHARIFMRAIATAP